VKGSRLRPGWLIVGIAGILVGGVLRFASLDHWTLWYDELASARRAADLSPAQHLREMRGNHPFYELALLRGWARLGQSDAWLRLPSAAAGTLTLVLAWLLARMFGDRAAALAAWLLALSPLHLMFSRVARPYALATFLAVLSTCVLVAALRRRRKRFIAAYALTAAVLLLTNLFAAALLLAHGLWVIWFLRRRPRSLAPWLIAAAAALALAVPWLAFNAAEAVTWSQDTPYRAQQMGAAVKLLYVPFTFALGETVHPLNFLVVVPAFLLFLAPAAAGVIRGRRGGAAFILFQLAVVLGLGLFFRAAAPKHMMIALPAFAVLLALGIERMRLRGVGGIFLAGIVIVSGISLTNYFTGDEFHDADMVTPWREITGHVETNQRSGDGVLIGYRGDADTWRMFRRYYRGGLPSAWLFDPSADWRQRLSAAMKAHARTWLLLHHLDPTADIESWLIAQGCSFVIAPFQEEEHTLQGLREGWSHARKYRSPLYTLYLIARPRGGGREGESGRRSGDLGEVALRREILERFEAEALHELFRGAVEQRPAGGIGAADDPGQAPLHEHAQDLVALHAADVLHAGAGNGLLVGDDGQRLERRLGEPGAAFGPPRGHHPGPVLGPSQHLIAVGDLFDLECPALFVVLGTQLRDEFADLAHVEALDDLGDVTRANGLLGGEEDGLDDRLRVGLRRISGDRNRFLPRVREDFRFMSPQQLRLLTVCGRVRDRGDRCALVRCRLIVIG